LGTRAGYSPLKPGNPDKTIAPARGDDVHVGTASHSEIRFQGLGLVELGRDIAIGTAAAAVAVAIRYFLSVPNGVLPFFFVVIAVCLVTVVAGIVAGTTTVIVGGLLTSHFIVRGSAQSDLTGANGYNFVGYFSVTVVILITSQLYRRSEMNRQASALALARREAEQQHLFAREMAHRLKNAMAIVQALARQTFDHDSPEVLKFDGRLRALADAHNLLNEHVKRPTASVSGTVKAAMSPFMAFHRIRMEGPSLELPAQQVVSLALALHELGTNAVKYGALSDPSGQISIRWDQFDEGVRLEWKEHDGPAVSAPRTDGFGSRLLRRTAIGAKVVYEEDGVRCTFALKA